MHMSAFTRIEFTVEDIVRSSLVKDYILARIQQEDAQLKLSNAKVVNISS